MVIACSCIIRTDPGLNIRWIRDEFHAVKKQEQESPGESYKSLRIVGRAGDRGQGRKVGLVIMEIHRGTWYCLLHSTLLCLCLVVILKGTYGKNKTFCFEVKIYVKSLS